MALTGMVDKRTLEKYEREAREKSRESWYLSWALDTNQEGEYVTKKKILIFEYLLVFNFIDFYFCSFYYTNLFELFASLFVEYFDFQE